MTILPFSRLTCAGVWLAIFGRVHASLTSEQAKKLHSLFDNDGNGKASLAEVVKFWSSTRRDAAKKSVPEVMSSMDWDGDGVISLYEVLSDEVWKKFDPNSQALKDQKASETRKFELSDKNGDGFLDEDEVVSFFFPGTHDSVLEVLAERLIEVHDTDHDGKLTPKEFAETVTAGDMTTDAATESFDKLDLDHDGRLDVKEVKAWESGQFKLEQAMKKLFDTADVDGDGHLSQRELDDATALGSASEVEASDAQEHLQNWAYMAEENEL